MDIAGMGTHVIECLRVRELIDKHAERFIMSVYTDSEAVYCRDRTHTTEHYAAIWAAKDAVFRSLGIKSHKALNWLDVEIVCETKVTASVIVRGPTQLHMEKLGVRQIHIAFSYSRQYATATAIALK